MTFLLGDTGKLQIGTLKEFTITSGTARETLLGTPLVLPTTEPGTSQVIYTVQSSDLPTISPSAPMKFNVALYCSGKVGVSASVINYRVLKNGSSIIQSSGASATATQFWTHTHWRTFDVVAGDVLEVRYWAAQADVNLDFYGLIVFPSQPIPHKPGVITKELALTNLVNGATFTTITPTVASTLAMRTYPYISTASSLDISAASTFITFSPNISYGLFRNLNGDVSPTTTQNVNATQRQIQKQWFPQNISFREVLR